MNPGSNAVTIRMTRSGEREPRSFALCLRCSRAAFSETTVPYPE